MRCLEPCKALFVMVLPWLPLSIIYLCTTLRPKAPGVSTSSCPPISSGIPSEIGREDSWRLAASHLFALTPAVTAVDQPVLHLFVQWPATPHLMQRPAAFCASISSFGTKSPLFCGGPAKLCTNVVLIFWQLVGNLDSCLGHVHFLAVILVRILCHGRKVGGRMPR